MWTRPEPGGETPPTTGRAACTSTTCNASARVPRLTHPAVYNTRYWKPLPTRPRKPNTTAVDDAQSSGTPTARYRSPTTAEVPTPASTLPVTLSRNRSWRQRIYDSSTLPIPTPAPMATPAVEYRSAQPSVPGWYTPLAASMAAWTQDYEYGIPITDLLPIAADGTTGTSVSFHADDAPPAIDEHAADDCREVAQRTPARLLSQQALLCRVERVRWWLGSTDARPAGGGWRARSASHSQPRCCFVVRSDGLHDMASMVGMVLNHF